MSQRSISLHIHRFSHIALEFSQFYCTAVILLLLDHLLSSLEGMMIIVNGGWEEEVPESNNQQQCVELERERERKWAVGEREGEKQGKGGWDLYCRVYGPLIACLSLCPGEHVMSPLARFCFLLLSSSGQPGALAHPILCSLLSGSMQTVCSLYASSSFNSVCWGLILFVEALTHFSIYTNDSFAFYFNEGFFLCISWFTLSFIYIMFLAVCDV